MPEEVLEAAELALHVLNLHKTERSQQLRHCCLFYWGRQHDHHSHDWNGVYRDPGVNYMMERLKPQGFVPANAIPYGGRKPSAHLPLGRQIVNRFTEILLGHGRNPTLQVPADRDTEDFLEAIYDETDHWDVWAEARDLAGMCGAAAVTQAIVNGEPQAEVLHPADLWVREWRESARWEPADVIEQRLVTVVVPGDGGKLESKRMWRTRRWTETHAIKYVDVPEDYEDEIPIEGEPVEHKAGRCPVVWLQNTRCTSSPDGIPDYDGTYHLLDEVDRLQSQTIKSSKANVDPTVVRKDEARFRRSHPFLGKGVGHVMDVGPEGDVKYLEVNGASIKMGWDGIANVTMQVLQTAECVIVTPENAGNYRSGEALQVLWRSMEAKAGRLRTPLRGAVRASARLWIALGKAHGVVNVEEVDEGEGEGIRLPPKQVKAEPPTPEDLAKLAEKGEAWVEPEPKWVAQSVGTGTCVQIQWPPFWSPTPQQLQAFTAALQTATAGAKVISRETAVRTLARYMGHDPAAELDLIEKDERAADAKMQAAMFPEEKEDDDPDVRDTGGDEPDMDDEPSLAAE